MKHAITIVIDIDALSGLTDQHLTTLWHVAQANPAPIEDRSAGDVAESIGREIIRRFIAAVGPELWAHQGAHAYLATGGDDRSTREKVSTREQLRAMAEKVRRLSDLFEGPDGTGTAGTDLAKGISNGLDRLASMEHAGMDTEPEVSHG